MRYLGWRPFSYVLARGTVDLGLRMIIILSGIGKNLCHFRKREWHATSNATFVPILSNSLGISWAYKIVTMPLLLPKWQVAVAASL